MRLRNNQSMWVAAASVAFGLWSGGCSDDGESGAEGEESTEDAESSAESATVSAVCEDRFLFAFAVDGVATGVIAAGDDDPFADADSVSARVLDANGIVVDEDTVPVGEGGVLALSSGGDAEVSVEVLGLAGEDEEIVARGRTSARAAGGEVIVSVSAVTSWVEPIDRVSCEVAAPATARLGHSVTPLGDGRILVAGGVSGQGITAFPSDDALGEPILELEVFDSDTGTVSAVGTLPVGLVYHAAALLDDGRVALLGGLTPEGEGWVPRGIVYTVDPAQQFAVEQSLFPLQSSRHQHRALAAPELGGVLLVGGVVPAGGAEVWNAETGSVLISQGQARRFHSLTPIASLNQALAIGGLGPDGNIDPSFELYNLAGEPGVGQTFGLPEGAGRALHGAAYLPGSNLVLLFGGYADGLFTQPSSSVWVFDPATQSVVAAPVTLESPRAAPSYFVLTDEDVVIVAGGFASGSALATAESLVVIPALPPATTPTVAGAPAPAPPTAFFGAESLLLDSGRGWVWGGAPNATVLEYVP